VAARRELTSLLAQPERRVLRAVAARLPRWVTSDGLTALGMAGALGAGAAYALSALDRNWLWAACVLLVVNWFGDSLDGTVARVRGTERPRYGYYLDHIVDAFSTAAVGVGLGLSPYVDLRVALAGVLAYLVLSINTYLETHVFGVFRLGYGRIGPTEGRIILVVVNVALASSGPSAVVVPVATGAVAALVVGMFVMVAVRIGRNLSRLARLDPPPPPPSYRRTAFTAASASTYPAPTSHNA
jgi:phosphatidylglycerophosphate synthase